MKNKLHIPNKSGLCKNCFELRKTNSAYCGQCRGEPKMIAYTDKQKNFPLLDKVVKHFKLKNIENIIFTYGDTIYTDNKLSYDLITHETTHIMQQRNYEDVWWVLYLAGKKFRLNQEEEAYKRQYQVAIKNGDYILDKIANDLSGKMYGEIISYNEAGKLIVK